MIVSIGNFLFRFRNGLFPAALLLVLLPGRDLFANPLHAVALGFCVALLGQMVRGATIGFQYVIRGGRNKRVYAEDLVTEGVYRVCRNPMYVGNLLIMAGLAVASNSLTCLLVAIPLFVFVYIAIIAAEEAFLRRKFGAAYAQYVADVPRWLPRLGAMGEALADMSFHWMRVLVKEFATPFGWITMLMLMSFWHMTTHQDIIGRRDIARALLVGYIALAVVYLTVRYLKLSRRIVAD
ncbi:MAG: isoprenylcysteine carboxylmethyltransferase family protein [Pseudomonadota bacterium]